MDTALEILPADIWRYYLIANAPEGSDTNFTWEHFAGVINKDLADVLGNFVNRVTKFCVARFDGSVPGEGEYGEEEQALATELDRRVRAYTDYLEAANSARRWANCAPSGWRAMNISPAPRPGPRSRPTARARRWACAWASIWCICSRICLAGDAGNGAHACTRRSCRRPQSFPGRTSRCANFSISSSRAADPCARVLFAKITDEQIAEWKERFAGTSADSRSQLRTLGTEPQRKNLCTGAQ